MLNLLTILMLEHRYIGLIISAVIIVIAVTAIVIRYFKRTKVDESNIDEIYPVKKTDTEETENTDTKAE